MNFLSVKYFKENKSNIEILVWRLKKTKKVDFTLDFYYLNAVSLKGKKDDEKKVEELRDRQYFSASLTLWRFSLPFFPGFALGLFGIGRQDGQLDK